MTRNADAVSAALLAATERLARASSQNEFGEALAARAKCIAVLAPARPSHADVIHAAIVMGEQVRLSMLRAIVQDRSALERLRTIAPACHAQSSVACTG